MANHDPLPSAHSVQGRRAPVACARPLAPVPRLVHHRAQMGGIFGSSGKAANPAGTVGSLVGAIGAAFSVVL